jgi:hypothetical protein
MNANSPMEDNEPTAVDVGENEETIQQGSVNAMQQDHSQQQSGHQISMHHHDPTAIGLSHHTPLHQKAMPSTNVHLSQLAPAFAFNPAFINMHSMPLMGGVVLPPTMNMKLPSSSPLGSLKKSDKTQYMPSSPSHSNGAATGSPSGAAGKNSAVFFNTANRTWTIQDIDEELAQYLADEKFDVRITMKIRGEEACQYVPEKLYSSHKYVIQHELEVGSKMQVKYPLLVSKIKVVNPATKEEITNSKNSKEIVQGVIEAALTLHSNKASQAILQGQMKVQFTDVSYHHEKGHFAMIISYYDPANLDHALFNVVSPEFRVYARKPTQTNQTETLTPGKPKPTIRKRKKDDLKTPSGSKRRKSANQNMSKEYQLFNQKLEELIFLKEQLSEEDKNHANEQSLQRLVQNDPDVTMETFFNTAALSNAIMNPNIMLQQKNLLGMNPQLPLISGMVQQSNEQHNINEEEGEEHENAHEDSEMAEIQVSNNGEEHSDEHQQSVEGDEDVEIEDSGSQITPLKKRLKK